MAVDEHELATAMDWLCGGDTGSSSKAIMARMLGGNPPRGHHPHDPPDLGRCIRLLDKIPAWRTRIRLMASVSPEWDFLSEHWQELERLYAEEQPSGKCPRTRNRMRELVTDAIRSDPEVTILSECDGFITSWVRHKGKASA